MDKKNQSLNLFYRKFGEGPPLIIIHGLYGSSGNWISIGKALAEHFEVFIIDMRNHGNSPFSNEHSYALMKDDIFRFIKAQQIKKAIIIGHSMGGKAAMFFAADFPEKVQSLIIIDISPRSYKSHYEFDPQSIDHKNIIAAMLSVNLSTIQHREDVDSILSHSIKPLRVRQFLLKNLYRNRDGSFKWKLNLEVLQKNLPDIMDGLDPERFSHGNGVTGFPVLFIRGEKSNYILQEDVDIIKTIFPMAEIVTIPDASHWLHADQPDLLIKTITYFILGQ